MGFGQLLFDQNRTFEVRFWVSRAIRLAKSSDERSSGKLTSRCMPSVANVLGMFITLRESNIAMENPPFEDVFPIENGDFPLLCLFTGGYKSLN